MVVAQILSTTNCVNIHLVRQDVSQNEFVSCIVHKMFGPFLMNRQTLRCLFENINSSTNNNTLLYFKLQWFNYLAMHYNQRCVWVCVWVCVDRSRYLNCKEFIFHSSICWTALIHAHFNKLNVMQWESLLRIMSEWIIYAWTWWNDEGWTKCRKWLRNRQGSDQIRAYVLD